VSVPCPFPSPFPVLYVKREEKQKKKKRSPLARYSKANKCNTVDYIRIRNGQPGPVNHVAAPLFASLRVFSFPFCVFLESSHLPFVPVPHAGQTRVDRGPTILRVLYIHLRLRLDQYGVLPLIITL